MVCKKCGRETPSANSKYCYNCGQSFYETKVKDENFVPQTVESKARKKSGFIAMLLILLVVIALVKYINYTESVEYLRDELIHGEWRENDDEWDISAHFYSNGVFKREFSDGSGRTFEWELLEDKTLVFDGRYYEYGEWSCEDGVIKIGERWEFVKRTD